MLWPCTAAYRVTCQRGFLKETTLFMYWSAYLCAPWHSHAVVVQDGLPQARMMGQPVASA